MKTIYTIEINTPDEYNVHPETVEDMSDSEKVEYGKEFAQMVHGRVLKEIDWFFEDSLGLEDNFIDDIEECYVDGWDEMADYDIDIKVTKK